MRRIHRLAAAIVTAFTCASASATVIATVVSNDATYGVIDGSQATRTLRVDGRGRIIDVNLTVAFSKCDNPPIGPNGSACIGRGSPFENEFTLVLTAPGGQPVTLVKAFSTYRAGSNGGAGRVSVTFDDEALRAAGPRVRAGSFRPAESLAMFDEMNPYGRWTLYLRDFSTSDPLEYFSSSLDIAYESIPEPGTLAILGLGLGLMGMRAARKR